MQTEYVLTLCADPAQMHNFTGINLTPAVHMYGCTDQRGPSTNPVCGNPRAQEVRGGRDKP